MPNFVLFISSLFFVFANKWPLKNSFLIDFEWFLDMAVPGQRLSKFAHVWLEAGADPALLKLVKKGHKI